MNNKLDEAYKKLGELEYLLKEVSKQRDEIGSKIWEVYKEIDELKKNNE